MNSLILLSNYTFTSDDTCNHFLTIPSYSLSNEYVTGINIPDATRVIKIHIMQIISTFILYDYSLTDESLV